VSGQPHSPADDWLTDAWLQASVRGHPSVAIHIDACVAALAGASEVLVSQTVEDLVAGSDLSFEDARRAQYRRSPRHLAPPSVGEL